MTSADALGLRGRTAGALTRLLAWLIDLAVSSVTLSAIIAAAVVVIDLVTGATVTIHAPSALGIPATTLWLGLYLFVSWAVPGRTPGMAVLGLLVVRGDGTKLGWGHALARVVALPLSFMCFLGLLGIVVGRRHRALHDVIADTLIVYDW